MQKRLRDENFTQSGRPMQKLPIPDVCMRGAIRGGTTSTAHYSHEAWMVLSRVSKEKTFCETLTIASKKESSESKPVAPNCPWDLSMGHLTCPWDLSMGLVHGTSRNVMTCPWDLSMGHLNQETTDWIVHGTENNVYSELA